MRDEREEIRARVDLVGLVGQKVLLKRAGRHWKGLCPFHDDRNPSFYVSSDSGRYKCWSCGEGGDIFTWVMKTQNVEFSEALKILALQAGVELSNRNPERDTNRVQNVAMMKEAQAFFVESFQKSSFAQDYCSNRGLDQDVIEKWGIGYSPQEDHALATRLRKLKYSLVDAKSLFLVEDDGSGAYFDKFRGRLMFPIHDERGELVAFGGRALGDIQPKYVNSSDTPLFRKSRVLYGLNQAKESIGKSRRAVLVEGYLDVIACHRAGVEAAVASLGTSLAEDHAKLLHRWCDETVILYDADNAGQKAADRACEVLQAQGVGVRVALLPPGSDPDTLLRDAGSAAVQAAVEGGLTPSEFRILQLERSVEPQSDEFWNGIVTILAETTSLSETEKHFAYIRGKYLAGSSQIEEQLRLRIRDSQRKKLRQKDKGVLAVTATMVSIELHPAEVVVIRAFLESGLRLQAYKTICQRLFISKIASQIEDAIIEAFPDSPPAGKPLEWLGEISSETVRELISEIQLSSVIESGLLKRRLGEVASTEFADALHVLQQWKERREVEELKGDEMSIENASMAIERLKAKHDREAARWDR